MVEMKIIDLIITACFGLFCSFGIGYCLGRIHGEEDRKGAG